MPKLKVLFVPTTVSGVVFYRQWQPYLALKKTPGIEAAIWWYKTDQYDPHPWEDNIRHPEIGPTIVRDLEAGCQWADVVVWMGLHRVDSLMLFRSLKNKYDKKFIMETDDYVLSIPSYSPAHSGYRPGSEFVRVALEQMKTSDGVIASTPFLKELYEPFNSNIVTVENVIDLTLWRKRPPPVRQRVNIGWVGGGTHNDDLGLIKNPMFRILDKFKDVIFTVLHGVPESLKHHKQIKWTTDFKPIDKYPEWVHRHKFDIGIAPLVDNNFNRGKSNLRWLEYSAMAIPTVASPLPHFSGSIVHGSTGFIASTEEQWEHYLTLLIVDATLRRTIGNNARNEVKQNWSLKSLGIKYKDVIKEFHNAEPDSIRHTEPDQRVHQRSERQPMDGGAEASQNSRSPGTVC